MKILRLFILLLCVSACRNGSNEITDSLNKDSLDLCPNATIYLQPYDDFTQKEAMSLYKKIQQGLNSVYGVNITTIKVLPNKALPQNSYYKPRNRYLANVLLVDLPIASSPTYIIGLTHKDISYKIHNHENYGIMGLTPLYRNKSIVSDYRVKGNGFIAVIVHEFGHGFYGAEHCSDVNCIMCDYQKHKGKPFKFSLCEDHEFMK